MFRTVCSVLALSVATLAAPAFAQATAPAVAPAQSEDARLAAFFQAAFLETARLSPETLSQLGMKERYDELGDYSQAGQMKALAVSEAQLARTKREFDPAKLSPGSGLSFDLFGRGVATQKMQLKWYWQAYAVTSGGSALDQIPVLLINTHKVDSVADAEAYVSRLKAVERVAGEVSDDIDQRTAKGFLPPAFVFGRVIPDARTQIKGAPFDSGPDHALWADFKTKVAALKTDDATKTRLLAAGEAALKGEWKRGYERYLVSLDAMSKRATTVNGVWALPQGDAFYADQVAFFTTTKLTPEQIHQTGLSEVARIRGEMEVIKAKVGFKGTLEQFFAFVKTDPKTHYPNTDAGKQQYLADAKKIIADYMAVAGKQFSTLPKQALEVRAVEPFREKTASTAFYNPGAPDGSRPGIFYVNLADMTQVQKVQLPAIAYHEGAPGHHFQIARSQEQTDLPMFRRLSYYGAYTEGWGLYAEKLGKEAGFYQDPYDDFGRLSLEIWRAVRLVVDTGIHAKHWSRDKAIAYMHDNTLNSDLDTAREIDRYFTSPGQATSYKIGQLKILELRAKAQKALGPKFDIRAFHETVLAAGALPLDVLETRVDAYIEGAK
ncbi:MAG: DUF885 domain-containing protein [Alphaproteobacteria bacterium]|nr:DUF885 domain-containing protein [Alphaproteobacteria bacterium]MBU1515768.1 DUF885 domain-containing protein [Alphaproteobacteria bacterium]MBU2097051.1 DUF885 domain-containing protein [Alphaproteobacteria bacterium]MBU2149567.1 DUF885 domain-containing protein [Alphaproteobacteria bacterium]MBU2308953.1 DUF885 domain-containing protein [Alphaproteobacteria bacterium]